MRGSATKVLGSGVCLSLADPGGLTWLPQAIQGEGALVLCRDYRAARSMRLPEIFYNTGVKDAGAATTAESPSEQCRL